MSAQHTPGPWAMTRVKRFSLPIFVIERKAANGKTEYLEYQADGKNPMLYGEPQAIAALAIATAKATGSAA